MDFIARCFVLFLGATVTGCSQERLSEPATGSGANGPLETSPLVSEFKITWEVDGRAEVWKGGDASVVLEQAFRNYEGSAGVWASGLGDENKSLGFQVMHLGEGPERPFEGTFDVSLEPHSPLQVTISLNGEDATKGTVRMEQDTGGALRGSLEGEFQVGVVRAEFRTKFTSFECIVAPRSTEPAGTGPDGKPLWVMDIDVEHQTDFCKAAAVRLGL